ncbi:hypothetical protein CWC46_21415 [Prodigiosinella confusarubida]|uniref:Uncharacterized protein n=1 Tax=Serratia sp. (strain ATCC 39006) TaxID=104623 RepID=A0A2I5TC27_SERS3|nr:hypothetical protein [Serratia sp. ATCC 39006]AUH02121.1 hypothetical protein CWC46_21415 [Serratia sp. ATCC 39006]AUH06443.1 hypothetical protein Ser39006_021410 [Serratia sp. ATCC 39006]
MMSTELKDKLVSVLSSLRENGFTPEEAVNHIIQALGSQYTDVSRINILTARLVVEVLQTAYEDDISAQNNAVILRKLGYVGRDVADSIHFCYPQLTPQDIGQIVLTSDAHSNTDRDTFVAAMSYAGYHQQESEQVASMLYP